MTDQNEISLVQFLEDYFKENEELLETVLELLEMVGILS